MTNSEELNKIARSLRNQGRDVNSDWLQHIRLGFNYRMSDINAAIGIAQMKRIDEILLKRKHVKKMYDRMLEEPFKSGVLIRQKDLKESVVSPFVYVLRLSDRFNKAERDKILYKLKSSGIQCSNYFTPIHLQHHYQDLGWKYGDMPITERISERTIALPFYNNLKNEQVEYICKTLIKAIKRIKE